MEENIQQNINVEKKQTYLNRESLEILTDPLDISYYKNLQNDEIVRSNLLGEFDNEGIYNISKDILLELVSAKKIIKESQDDKYILNMPTKTGFNELVFTLQVSKDFNNKKVSTLKLIETYVRFNGNKEVLKTIIARYKDDDDIYFILKIKKLFNIIDADEDDGKDINNEEFLKIVLKKFQDFKALEIQEPIFDNVAKEYIDNIINILEKNPGKFSDYILRHYFSFVNELKEIVNKTGSNRLLKIKLDNLINETKKKFKDPILEPLIANARNIYLTKNKEAEENILVPKKDLVKAEEKSKAKPQEKAAESSKPSKKSSSKPKAKGKAPQKSKGKEEKKVVQQPFKLFSPANKKVNVVEKPAIKPELPKNQTAEKVDLTIDTSIMLVVSKIKQNEKQTMFVYKENRSFVYGNKKNSQQELTR
ncbi:MAG: hypothetical protein PHS54_01695 [Clostridia bacterium]|nr:hypothetical protein [Clostridia bacterium]